jgi:FMN-dependent NADH-azoreductase
MNILHIDCSPRQVSHSRQLSRAIVGRLLVLAPDASITYRDLGSDPIPHASVEYATALSNRAALDAASIEAMRLSDVLIGEVEAADVIVIGTPMNNFTVPSVLKAWIDQIVRIGRTFARSSTGKHGLLRDRPVLVGIASGGVFSGDKANQPDFLTSYLSAALGCVGLKTIHYLPLQGTAALTEEQSTSAREALVAHVDASMASLGEFKPSSSGAAPRTSRVLIPSTVKETIL